MSSIKKFVPYLDPDGILRVSGRLDYIKDMSDELKHLAILPKRHKLTKLFVLDKHEHLTHRAAETVLAFLINNEGVKPMGGVQTVRHYLLDCFTCKLLSKSRGKQLMSLLPEYCIKPRRAVFTSISIDYAGPFEVKRGRSTEKRWICVFMCNATSTIRLEVVESPETSAFLNAFHQFQCLSGFRTKHIRSDCATTFVGAHNALEKDCKNVLKDLQRCEEVQAQIGKQKIVCDFSTTASSHHQGLVERRICLFREVIEGILGPGFHKRTPTDFELMTMCKEAEYVMNCKPLA